jgi:hypothetical protein
VEVCPSRTPQRPKPATVGPRGSGGLGGCRRRNGRRCPQGSVPGRAARPLSSRLCLSGTVCVAAPSSKDLCTSSKRGLVAEARGDQWDVGFDVWDAVSCLPPRPAGVMSVQRSVAGFEELVAVGLHRGSELLHGEALTVWSFRPMALLQDPRWHLDHAILEFVSVVSELDKRDPAIVYDELVTKSGHEFAERLEVRLLDRSVGAIRVEVGHGGWVVATLNEEFGMACCGSGINYTEFQLADHLTWPHEA